MRTQIL